MLLIMKRNQTGLLVMSIGGLIAAFSFELGKYIHHNIGYIGISISFVLMLIGIILHFKNFNK